MISDNQPLVDNNRDLELINLTSQGGLKGLVIESSAPTYKPTTRSISVIFPETMITSSSDSALISRAIVRSFPAGRFKSIKKRSIKFRFLVSSNDWRLTADRV